MQSTVAAPSAKPLRRAPYADLLAELKRIGRVAELSGDRWQLATLTASPETTLTLNI